MSRFSDVRLKASFPRPMEPVPLDEPVPVDELPTPALIIDLDIFNANLNKMQGYLDEQQIALRAHTKMHKCPHIARQQVELGARGVCAAKISEAEIMCEAGIDDVLVTSPVVTPEKLEWFMTLREQYPGLKIVVDDAAVAASLQRMAKDRQCSLDVFIDIDPGMGRTGIEAGEPALALGRLVADASHLNLAGLQMYAGNCMHIEGHHARREKYTRVMEKGLQTRELFDAAGIDIPVFSGGGTGTYDMESDLGLLTELQAGSYAFMDIEYRDIGGVDASGKFEDFRVSLFVLVTAISKPQSRLITVDGGFKVFASDKMAPEFRDVEGVVFHWGGD
ncbi:MAG: alanine racemase, partial [Proteobacteria bacterium]|nr:alanine racemase [Pseudomonadota bacterium]